MTAELARQARSKEHRSTHAGSVSSWLKQRMEAATMRVEQTPLFQVAGWGFINADGVNVSSTSDVNAYANLDSEGRARFFTFSGVRVFASGREVHDYEQPGIIQVKDPTDPEGYCATAGLLVDRKTGDVLIQATAEPFAAEPGKTPGAYMSIRPSVQTSYDNLRLNKVKFSESIDPATYTHSITVDASRIQGKVRYGVTFVDRDAIDLRESPNYQWFTQREIGEAISGADVPFNAFFQACYNVARETRRPTNRQWRRAHQKRK